MPTQRQSMARHLTDLRAMSDEDLIKQHDAWADWTNASVDYYLEELARRSQDRQTEAMLRYTRWLMIMTIIITAATILNVVIAWLLYQVAEPIILWLRQMPAK